MTEQPLMTTQIPSVKLVLLGESSVGKSSIVAKYATDTFIGGKEATIGAAFLAKICTAGDRIVKLDIWDTAGQERFHSLAPMYYRNALAAMVVFDVTKYTTFEKAKKWVDDLQRQANNKMLITLIGNKTDLVNEREVAKEEVENYATESKLLYIETSAKAGSNINHVFQTIAKNVSLEQVYARQNQRNTSKSHISIYKSNGTKGDRSSNCAC